MLDPAGRPVEGARVELRTPHGGCIHVQGMHQRASTTTDDAGRFTLPRPESAMEFYVTDGESAPGWAPAEGGARIRLKPAAYLTLELADAARVTIAHGYWAFARRDAEGIVKFGPLPPGLVLSVSADSPDRTRFGEMLMLRPGESRTLKVERPAGHEIRGQVSPPLEGVRVEAHQSTGESALAYTAADGSFALRGLRAAGARLVAIAPEPLGKPVIVQDVEADENVELSWND